MNKTPACIVALAAISFACQCGGAEQGVYMYGAGSLTCGKFMSTEGFDREHYRDAANQWVEGFLGSAGYYGQSRPRPTDMDTVALWVRGYCERNPTHSLAASAAALVEDLGGAKAHHKWTR